MPKYTFDVRLNAAFSIEAATEADARAQLVEVLDDCADVEAINVGALRNGDPLLGEASMTAHWLAQIDGKDIPLPAYPSPLHYYAAARDHGWAEVDSDHPEDYCAAYLSEDEVRDAEIASYHDDFRRWEAQR